MEHDLLRIGDAARLLGVSEDHLRDLTPRGKEKIPCSRTPGGHRLFDPATIEEIKEHGLDAWMSDNAKPGFLCRRTYMTVTAGIMLIDFGNALVAGFGEDQHGRSSTAPIPGTFNLVTDSVTWGHIENIALVLDPLIVDPKWSDEERAEALNSYTYAMSALLAGHVTIDSAPLPEVLPVNDLRVIRAAYDAEGLVSPHLDLNPNGIVERGKLRIPPYQSWRTFIAVPNRGINAGNGTPAKSYEGHVYVWTGVIVITQRNQLDEAARGAVAEAAAKEHEGQSREVSLEYLAKRFPGVDWERQLELASRQAPVTPITHSANGSGYYMGDPRD